MEPKLLVFSGAGISAESGLSTFRDPDGLWAKFDHDKVCNIATWKQNYVGVHEFYNSLRAGLADVEPNAAHKAVAEWASRYSTTNITQNVDDLFERAGCRNVIHVHGHLKQMKCTACGHVWDIGPRAYDLDERCAKDGCECRKGIKPNVVFFGEMAPLYSALHRALDDLRSDDVVVVIGTANQVVPIHALLENRPGYKVLNNLDRADSAYDRSLEDSAYDELIFKPATLAVADIDAILRKRLGDK